MNEEVALAQTGGNLDLLTGVAEIFLEAWPEQAGRLRRALGESDAETLARIAHVIKGGASTIAADIVTEIAASLEATSNRRNLTSAPEHVDALEKAMELLGRHFDETYTIGATP